MISSMPDITLHAFQRAEDRLKLSRDAFAAWVRATYRDWLPANRDVLAQRGLVRTSDRTRFYVCPWTPYTNIAIVLANDNAIKTVLVFDRYSAIDTPTDPGNPYCNAAARLVLEDSAPAITVLRDWIGSIDHPVDGPGTLEALTAYADGRLHVETFRRIIQAKIHLRQALLDAALAPTEAAA